MEKNLNDIYQPLISKYEVLLKKTERLSRNISLLRLFDFLAGLFLVIYFAQRNNIGGVILSLFIAITIFLVLMRIHSKVNLKKNLYKAFLKLNKDELTAVNGDFSIFRDGLEFNNPAHHFTSDLDIFGKGSLFQYLNRTATETGYKSLGERLKAPLTNEKEIDKAQLAVEELNENIQWRQKFQANGMAFDEDKNDRKKVEDWSQSQAIFSSVIFKVLVVLVPLLTLVVLGLTITGYLQGRMLLLYLFIPWGISGMYAIRVTHRHNAVSKTSGMLVKYARLLKEIELLDSKSELLDDLKKQIFSEKYTASSSIKDLSAILTALDNRLNFVSWSLLNGLFLWDILQMIRLESWQNKHKDHIKEWFVVVAEFDVLNSFANFKFNRKEAIFPTISQKEFKVEAKKARHPLIDKKQCIANDISISSGHFVIITGANMAGKSTYLRMIGVNLILSMCGAPVCAESFVFKPIHLFTSIRTSDSLHENESYFYAELKRLKAIIDELRSEKELFIILDEILKGTNSKDKHAGSEALLKQLLSFKATGIVATHDVLLGKLQDKFPDRLKNNCFEVDIDGNQLNFDYLLREGVSKNLNATILMREMGITI